MIIYIINVKSRKFVIMHLNHIKRLYNKDCEEEKSMKLQIIN